jgi:hypothetical protein
MNHDLATFRLLMPIFFTRKINGILDKLLSLSTDNFQRCNLKDSRQQTTFSGYKLKDDE